MKKKRIAKIKRAKIAKIKPKKSKVKPKKRKASKRQPKGLPKPQSFLPTLLDQITLDFKCQVIQNKNAKINATSILDSFCTDERFKKEFKEMFLERAYSFFGVSIRHLYDSPVNDILAFLRDNKMKKIKFNWK
jgi:hypothetical protein